MDPLSAQSAYENQKSSLAFRTISEVSVEIDVPQHVLRFWESRFSQVKPMKRGGGRRYYRPEDVELLRQIKTYLYKHGYTIKGVQRLLKEHKAHDLAAHSASHSLAKDLASIAPISSDMSAPSPEQVAESFEETLEQVTQPQAQEEPLAGTPLEQGLAAMTLIHDEIEMPPQPMRTQSAAELVQAALAEGTPKARMISEATAKETGYAVSLEEPPSAYRQGKVRAGDKAELSAILADLTELREMLRSVA